ncbi:MAG: L-serine ammonia-lyase [Gammaproteobacteria bacterium]
MTSVSVFDLFKVGIGPSSSHTVGPMIAGRRFVAALDAGGLLPVCVRVRAELYGSLGATGRGHGSTKAVLLGLAGETPEGLDVENIPAKLAAIREGKQLRLMGRHVVKYNEREDLILHKRKSLPYHPNGMIFRAFDESGAEVMTRAFYSVGGGFVVDEESAASGGDIIKSDSRPPPPYPFASGNELLAICAKTGMPISDIMMANEKTMRDENDIRQKLLDIWRVMQECVDRGARTEGVLPGGLQVKRRAPQLFCRLREQEKNDNNPLLIMDWINACAIAVNEENAAGGRVVTAPTNGAAGVVPAVLHYYARHCKDADDDGVVRFLLAAAAIGALYKMNASISGAEVGCQGEIGSACSMAAAGLAEVSGASPQQVENAAEIAMEHNLGLTCDPIGGLVQIPCIERNAVGANKAVNAVRLALAGDGAHFVSLDKVIRTMRETGRDMKDKYKETARGGLAANVLEVPVNIVEC